MTRSEENALIISARRHLAAIVVNRHDAKQTARALGVVQLCRKRPRIAAYVTIESGSWSHVFRPVAPGGGL